MLSTTDESLARECARYLRSAFLAYNSEFRAITHRARTRFECRDWQSGRADAVERIELYDEFIAASAEHIEALLGERLHDHALWMHTKALFQALIEAYPDIEFVKTYFSSVTRRVFQTVGVDPEIEFVGDETIPLRNIHDPIAQRTYVNTGSLQDMFRAMLEDFSWSVGFEDLDRSAMFIGHEVLAHYRRSQDNDAVQCVDVMEPVFYRGTRAYLVGRVSAWTRVTPIVIALKHGDRGVSVEAVLQTEDRISILFGFARSYFHVDLEVVGAAITFLRRLLPRKPVNELFTILGRAKQGKTERYRDLASHLENSRDRFVYAPGEKGMVMIVFTLPSYDVVFKVIRNKFPYPKSTSREEVMQRYELVFKHDKVGRLVDTQEFRSLRFHKERFVPELLEELLQEASRSVRLENDYVVIAHAYVERRLRPLDLYVRQVGGEAAARAVLDYGQAIKDLAATNIFPGDLLLKNFGVSRHGRVIFYDYDELCLLTDCNFRDLPVAETYEDEVRGEAWFYVANNDVFPEQFGTFLGLDESLKPMFREAHGELLAPRFWRETQKRLRAGEVIDVPPYRLPEAPRYQRAVRKRG